MQTRFIQPAVLYWSNTGRSLRAEDVAYLQNNPHVLSVALSSGPVPILLLYTSQR